MPLKYSLPNIQARCDLQNAVTGKQLPGPSVQTVMEIWLP
jgi:hypothetical protein